MNLWLPFLLFAVCNSFNLDLGPEFVVPDALRLVEAIPDIQSRLAAALPTLDLRNLTGSEPNHCLATMKDSLNHFLHSQSMATLIKESGFGINELGSYQGCKNAHGRYYTLDVMVVKMGLCLPVVCEQADLEVLRDLLFELIRKNFKEFPIDPSYKSYLNFYDVEKRNDYSMTKGAYISFGLVFVCLVVGIVVSFVEPRLPADALSSRARSVLASFNLYKSAKNLFFSVNRVDPNLDVLNGARTLAMGWVVFGHMLMMVEMAPFLNILDLMNEIQGSRKYVIYMSADLSVDVFFCFTGFLGILVTTEQLRGPWLTKLKYIPLIYLHRYLRLLPVYAAAVLTLLYMLPHLHNGPIYYSVQSLRGTCEDNWYYNALYINNFHSGGSCGGWTWYLANDFQMYLLVPPIVLLYQFRKVLAYLFVTALLFASAAVQTWIQIYNKENGGGQGGRERGDWSYAEMYSLPYTRICPFLVGIFIAWIYMDYRIKQKARDKALAQARAANPDSLALNASVREGATSKSQQEEEKPTLLDRFHSLVKESFVLRCVMYVAGFGIMLFFVLINFEFTKADNNISNGVTYLHTIVRRPAFVFGLMLMMYPAFLGKARVLRAVLGMELFNALSKVVYSAYMFNMIVIAYYHATREDGLYFSMQKMWATAIDVYVLTFALGIFTTLVFEYPIIGLSKEFLRPKRASIISGGDSAKPVPTKA